MLVFPGCKINFGLNITQKLPNGYHTIESIFFPISLSDILEIAVASGVKNTQFTYSGLAIPGDQSNNIIKKAYDILCHKYDLPPISAHLHKIVPMGAGLGGGSADASAMLHMLNKLFDLSISKTDLINLAKTLGADCPFFIENKPAFVTGTGEQIETIDPGLSGKNLVLIYPNIHIDTSKAFKSITPKEPDETIVSIVQNYPIDRWKEHLRNDFETYVFKTHPEIAQIKEKLYAMGAIYVSLSGSGSSVYGIFEKHISGLPSEFHNYFTYTCSL